MSARRPAGAQRRRLALVATALLAAVGLFTVGVNALYTDTATVPANTFTTGDLDLTASPASAAIVYSGMIPGDTVTQPLTVANTGSAALRYAMQSTTTENVLAAQLDLTVKVGVSSCTTAGFDASGTLLYGPGDLGATAAMAVFGSSAQGAQAGDRTLSSGATETLCLRVQLPLSSSNSFQGTSTTATFSMVAEQTANNP